MRHLIEPIARFGLAARGVVYIVVGMLAARRAAGWGGRTTDADGALRFLGGLDENGLVLTVVAAGLVAYALWRFGQAFWDLDGKGDGIKGYGVRAGYVMSGVVHAGLGLTALGMGLTGGSGSVRTWVARFLAEPYGVWAVALAGAGVMGSGLWQFYKAVTAKFEDRQRTSQMSARTQRWGRRIGRFGLSARGVTFLIVGWFLVRAARFVNAREAKDLGDALRTLEAHAYGAWLLGLVAVGLAAYGLLSMMNARYRRIV